MKRKGFEPSAIMMITVVVLGGVVIGTTSSKMASITEDKADITNEKLDQFHREIELSTEDSGLAKNQLRATNYLVTLRSIHCSTLQNAILADTVENMDGGTEGELDTENKHLKMLSFAFLLEEESVKKLRCRGADSVYETTFGNKLEDIKSGLDCVTGPVDCGIGIGQDIVRGAAAKVVTVGGYFGDDPPKCRICGDSTNDQPGRFGNVHFSYPSSEDGEGYPIVIDAKEDYAKPNQALYVYNYITPEEDGPNIDNSLPDNWNAWSQGKFKTSDNSENQPFFLSPDISDNEPIRFAPDPTIGRYTRSGLTEEARKITDNDKVRFNEDNAENPPNDCNEYPIKPFRTAMINVPLLTNSSLYREADITGSHIPLSKDVTLQRGTCRGYKWWLSNSPSEEDYKIGGIEAEEIMNSLHADYEFVICPGSEGRIQSNAGLPYHTGKAQDPEDWKGVTKFDKGKLKHKNSQVLGLTAGENTVYPRIELSGMPSQNAGCFSSNIVDEAEIGDDISSGKWVPQSDANDRIENECGSYRNLKTGYSERGIMTDVVGSYDGGDLRVYQYMCGLLPESAYGKTYWKFKKLIRLASEPSMDNPTNLYSFVNRIKSDGGGGRLGMPESVRIHKEGGSLKIKDEVNSHDLVVTTESPDIEECSGENSDVIRGGDFYDIKDNGDTVECRDVEEVRSETSSEIEGLIEAINDKDSELSEGEKGWVDDYNLNLQQGIFIEICDSDSGFCYSSGDPVETDNSIGNEYDRVELRFETGCDEEYLSSDQNRHTFRVNRISRRDDRTRGELEVAVTYCS